MWLLLPLPHMFTMFVVLHVSVGKGVVQAIGSQKSSNQDFKARPALSGPPLPGKGFAGRLLEVRPKNACCPIRGLPNSSSVFVALIRRYNCSFAAKVLHVQRAGYQAAVAHNVNSQGLLSRVSGSDAKQKIHIPSTFTPDVAPGILKWFYHSGKLSSMGFFISHLHIASDGAPQSVHTVTSACKCHIRLPGPCLQIATLHIFWMITVSVVIASLLIEKYLSTCKKWKRARNQSCQEKGNEQASFSLLSSKYQECAICLEKYLEYDSLKVLSCSHAFHSRCIDLWHITQTRSKTCPLCMQKVMLVVRLQTVRLWKEEARVQGKNRKLWPGKAKPSLDQ